MLPALALLAFGSSLIKGYSQIQQGSDEADALRESARIDMENAKLARAKGESDVGDMRTQAGAFFGTQRAAIAQSGLGAGGTNAALAAQSAAAAEKDVGNTRADAALRAAGFERKAQQSRVAAKQAKTAGYVGAFTTMISSASDMYGSQRMLK
jgi:hypothetical protein